MLRRILAATLCLLAAGCTSVAYYAQAVEGQMKLMAGYAADLRSGQR